MPSRLLQSQPSLCAPSISPFASPSRSPRTQFTNPNSDPRSTILPPVALISVSLLLLLSMCFRKITRKRTAPDSRKPRRFSYATIRRATDSFSASRLLGQGGFGSVFRGSLAGEKLVAVKVMDCWSIQGECEFQNELLFASKLASPYVITATGFSSNQRLRQMLLIYELMPNGDLQDALIHRKRPELAEWKKRFNIVVDVARGIEYLHSLDPPVVHGDIKPSNVLLDCCFSAKIADFGLACLKSENRGDCNGNMEQQLGGSKVKESDVGKIGDPPEGNSCQVEVNNSDATEDHVLGHEETDSVATGFEELSSHHGQDSALSAVMGDFPGASPRMVCCSASSEADIDGGDVAGTRVLADGWKTSGKEAHCDVSQRHDNAGSLKTGIVKDYVMQWIGTEVHRERPKSDWIGTSASSGQLCHKVDKNKILKKHWDWWVSFHHDDKNLKKRRKPREWWKEEYCEELEKKKKKKKKKKLRMGINVDDVAEEWWPGDEEMCLGGKKGGGKSKSGTVGWFGSELFRSHGHGHDLHGAEFSKSGGICSTPSMRGTVCYVAPEYGGGGVLSEKSDVYSFGVLLLVLIAGRRPLQLNSSPVPDFRRTNLIQWARHLARAQKFLDLVDKSVQSLDQEQAALCITIALLCLQKSPARRPSAKEIVGMLTGEMEPPSLPAEFSPSPPFHSPRQMKSQRKVR